MFRRFAWLAVTVGWVSFVAVAGPWLHNAVGLWLVAILGFFGLTLYWWGTMWFLLSARVSWRALLPSAVATALFWVGMEVVFSFIFSGTVISDDKKYGPIGVVFALMSWLIAIGVVIILGAVVGLVWRERDLSFSKAFRWLRRSSDRKKEGQVGSIEEARSNREASVSVSHRFVDKNGSPNACCRADTPEDIREYSLLHLADDIVGFWSARR